MKEANKLLQLSEMKGLPYEPAKDGFVFSNAEIHAAIDKDRRLNTNRTPISATSSPANSPQPPEYAICNPTSPPQSVLPQDNSICPKSPVVARTPAFLSR